MSLVVDIIFYPSLVLNYRVLSPTSGMWVQTELQRLENWRDKETTKAQVETSIYNYLYDEATGLPTESYDDQEIAELSKVIFLHLYRQSPATNYPIYPNVA